MGAPLRELPEKPKVGEGRCRRKGEETVKSLAGIEVDDGDGGSSGVRDLQTLACPD